MTPYQLKANSIISDSIKSAIFIDEKALEFYSQKSSENVLEESLSIDLYKNFKEHGVSLAIHKFLPDNITDKILKDYLFNNRDLVLLDWKLDGDSGEDKSLKLLEDVVNSAHIHFCAIYTSVTDLDNVLDNLITYFSGKTRLYFDNVKTEISEHQEDVNSIINKIDLYNTGILGRVAGETVRDNNDFLKAVNLATGTSDNKEALKLLKMAFLKTEKSEIENPIPEVVSKDKHTIVINNTIITILNKDKDSDPKGLIDKLSAQVVESKNSFTQLLGLEMQNIFSKKGAFIDSNLLQVSKETLAHHRNLLIQDGDTDLAFTQMMKNVLLEHAGLSLSSASLSILDESVMRDIDISSTPPDDDLAHMNVFYNSLTLKSNKKLNFGDVFVDVDGGYYMCITALCDCYRPSKIKNIYYFVKGTKMDRLLALKLGDSAFINFLKFNQCVVWSNIDKDSGDSSLERYRPVYIKPLSYHVKDFVFTDNTLNIRRIYNNEMKGANEKEIGEDIEFINVEYITTVKPTYAQRIANHAFSHPVRVGVDFVKK